MLETQQRCFLYFCGIRSSFAQIRKSSCYSNQGPFVFRRSVNSWSRLQRIVTQDNDKESTQ
ncbi:unnamed protein product [Coffea canephora]|uniref:Uncharacterized protein n=1 Tax=Coffea canephora TaxID=49390 RepID=A0A068U756_COFCA|nr:unnamed protein product [Coffea canephora]